VQPHLLSARMKQIPRKESDAYASHQPVITLSHKDQMTSSNIDKVRQHRYIDPSISLDLDQHGGMTIGTIPSDAPKVNNKMLLQSSYKVSGAQNRPATEKNSLTTKDEAERVGNVGYLKNFNLLGSK
jgi:hypothetical protein